jgi:hypothetical protein
MKATARQVCTRALVLGVALALAPLAQAQDAAPPATQGLRTASPVSAEAQAVLDRMTTYLRTLQTFAIDSQSSRDEVVALGYKVQNNERARLLVQRPNRLQAEVRGDVRNRAYYYDGARLTIYSPDDAAYVRFAATDNLRTLVGNLLDAGVEMPLMDVLYQAAEGSLTRDVVGGVLVGDATIDGVETVQLAFRQPDIDWQLWVDKGERPLPRRILITTRHEVGEPQYEATLHWDLAPKVSPASFAFKPPAGATEIPLADNVAQTASP